MGYYTAYTLTASPYPADVTSTLTDTVCGLLETEIKKMNVFERGGDITFGHTAYTTWYDWEQDLRLLSKRFPNVLFCLHGEGEQGDDLWDAYFLDGRAQMCKAVITYPDFNPNLLSPYAADPEDVMNGKYSYQVSKS